MSETISSVEQNNGWKHETEARAAGVAEFLKKYFTAQQEAEKADAPFKRYDPTTELHFSGGRITGLHVGDVAPTDVLVYYEGGRIDKIHAFYSGTSTDIILHAKALEDYLAS